MPAEVVDLFCGIGGLSAGFRDEGFDVRAGLDLDGSCRYAYERNIGAEFVAGDLRLVAPRDLSRHFSGGAPRVLVGCAPCQPFSLYTRLRKPSGEDAPDDRWSLLEEFARVVEAVRPDVVSMENVSRVALHPVFGSFVARLRSVGYTVTHGKVRAHDHGVPQRRTRLVLFASLHGRIRLERPTYASRPRTVRDAIGDLPALAAGGSHPDDPVHTARNLGERNLRRIRATAEGGSWRDWDPDLRLDCHKREAGTSFRAVYGRMRWDEPSPVITTQCLGLGNGRFGHPEQDRAISVREASLLQTFPPDFEFVPPGEPVNQMRLARWIGNAVPVLLARTMARSVKTHLAAAGVGR